MMEKIVRTEAEWKKLLSPERYRILRERGTEPPGSCGLIYAGEPGSYHCAACGLELFRSGAKFQSGTGWPSFTDPVAEDRLSYEDDFSFGMKRTEARCARCQSHLGHVFMDGPGPGNRRFCINGLALDFKAQE